MAYWIKCRQPVRTYPILLPETISPPSLRPPMSDSRQMERKLNMPVPKSLQANNKTDAKKPTGAY